MKFHWIITWVLLAFACNQPTNQQPQAPKNLPVSIESPAILQQINRVNQYPDSTPLRIAAIEILDSIGALKEAIAQVDSLIKRDSLHAGYWTKKGELSEKIGDTSGAIRCYRYAIRIYPTPDLKLRWANLLAEQKNDTALLLLKSIASEWNDATYLSHVAFIRGVYYARKGMAPAAHHSLDECIRMNYNYMEAYMEKGFLYWDAGNIAAAKKIFSTVIQLKGTYADGYYWLANCEARLKDTSGAVAHFQQAQRLDPAMSIPGYATSGR